MVHSGFRALDCLVHILGAFFFGSLGFGAEVRGAEVRGAVPHP